MSESFHERQPGLFWSTVDLDVSRQRDWKESKMCGAITEPGRTHVDHWLNCELPFMMSNLPQEQCISGGPTPMHLDSSENDKISFQKKNWSSKNFANSVTFLPTLMIVLGRRL